MENDKHLWPVNKKISQGILLNIDPKGSTLLIGVGSCSILDHLVKKMESKYKIDIIEKHKHLLDVAQEKYGEKCNYLNEEFLFCKLEKCYDNVISTIPFNELPLNDIDRIFNKYFNVCNKNIIYFESKSLPVKNSYIKMIIDNKNKSISDSKHKWELIEKKNYHNIPPVNLCILRKIKN